MGKLGKLWVIPFLLITSTLPAAGENLLLITVDTLRADHLGCYGYAEAKTPAIDQLAAEGVLFEAAYSEVPITLPAHTTLLTGQLPFAHGVRDNAGFALPTEAVTLAEVLQQEGFQTAAFVSSYVLSSRFGLAQGFDHYDDRFAGGETTTDLRRPANETSRQFLAWLNKTNEKPFFSWIHFYDPHAPYNGGYDAEISRVDVAIGEIVAALQDRRQLDNTTVVFVADHGEALGEHGESAHGFFVYDATIRIPLIIRPSKSLKMPPLRVGSVVSLIDLFPTAIQLLRLRTPSSTPQGRSAVRAMLGRKEQDRPVYAESYLPELQFGWARLLSLRVGQYKWIDAPHPELYDLKTDPGETTNIFSARQALAGQLKQQLDEYVARYQPSDPEKTGGAAQQKVDPETAEKLAALGYAALSSPIRRERSVDAPDPKNRIATFERYQRILGSVHGKPTKATLEELQRIRRDAPEMRGIHYLEGLVSARLGDLARARDSYLAALDEDPNNNGARANLAQTYIQLRDMAAAESILREVLKQDPSEYRSRNNYAALLRMRGDNVAALSELERVVSEAPGYGPGWLNLGVSQAMAGRASEAEKTLRHAIALAPDNAAAYLHLARVLTSLGKTEEARAALRRARELDPRIGQ